MANPIVEAKTTAELFGVSRQFILLIEYGGAGKREDRARNSKASARCGVTRNNWQ